MGDIRTNAGFVITNSISVGNAEFVMGVNMKNPDNFVTWKCSGGSDYYWGHYTDSLLKATKDLCLRALEEVQYLEQRQERENVRRTPDTNYTLTGIVEYDGNSAVIEFPTQELQEVIESIGITTPPERVYLGGYSDIKVQLKHDGNKIADGLIRLLKDDNSLRMVNEVAKAVFQSDHRVYERVEKNLEKDFYQSAEDLLRDVAGYTKYINDISINRKKTGSREER